MKSEHIVTSSEDSRVAPMDGTIILGLYEWGWDLVWYGKYMGEQGDDLWREAYTGNKTIPPLDWVELPPYDKKREKPTRYWGGMNRVLKER